MREGIATDLFAIASLRKPNPDHAPTSADRCPDTSPLGEACGQGDGGLCESAADVIAYQYSWLGL